MTNSFGSIRPGVFRHSFMRQSLIFIAAALTASPTLGAIVSSSSFGNVDAGVMSAFDNANSFNASDTIGALATENNSLTDSDLEWEFDASSNCVTFSATALEEKTVSAKPGGAHSAQINYEFEFTIDTVMDFSLNGTYGFDYGSDPTSGTDDSISYDLSSGGSPIVNGGITTGGTVVYSESGTLAPGTYKLSVNLFVNETINNAGNRGGIFDGKFILSDSLTGVPEPTSLSLLAVGMLLGGVRRRRKIVA